MKLVKNDITEGTLLVKIKPQRSIIVIPDVTLIRIEGLRINYCTGKWLRIEDKTSPFTD